MTKSLFDGVSALNNLKPSPANQRILDAAVDLFSKQGYNGASTRDIARLANVNEVTVYRYYACKRALFAAAVESELSKISFGADAISGLAQASNARAALRGLFGLISDVIARHPEMARLLQFAALEMGEELKPICHRHLEGLLDISTSYLNRWIDPEESVYGDSRLLILAFISTTVGIESLFPVMWGERSPVSGNTQISACADIWCTTLVAGEAEQ